MKTASAPPVTTHRRRPAAVSDTGRPRPRSTAAVARPVRGSRRTAAERSRPRGPATRTPPPAGGVALPPARPAPPPAVVGRRNHRQRLGIPAQPPYHAPAGDAIERPVP